MINIILNAAIFNHNINKIPTFALVIYMIFNIIVSTGLPLEDSRIVGGSNAQDGSYPYMVYMRIKTDGGQTALCGGAIITRRTILTAAHCFDV